MGRAESVERFYTKPTGNTMSLSMHGQWITCDNGCGSRARMPISLLNGADNGAGGLSPVAGWLFVSRGGSEKHYCSNCRSVYLKNIGTGPYLAQEKPSAAPEPE